MTYLHVVQHPNIYNIQKTPTYAQLSAAGKPQQLPLSSANSASAPTIKGISSSANTQTNLTYSPSTINAVLVSTAMLSAPKILIFVFLASPIEDGAFAVAQGSITR